MAGKNRDSASENPPGWPAREATWKDPTQILGFRRAAGEPSFEGRSARPERRLEHRRRDSSLAPRLSAPPPGRRALAWTLPLKPRPRRLPFLERMRAPRHLPLKPRPMLRPTPRSALPSGRRARRDVSGGARTPTPRRWYPAVDRCSRRGKRFGAWELITILYHFDLFGVI